jgi:hypothetical protein
LRTSRISAPHCGQDWTSGGALEKSDRDMARATLENRCPAGSARKQSTQSSLGDTPASGRMASAPTSLLPRPAWACLPCPIVVGRIHGVA